MNLGKVIRELDVEPDEELVPVPEKVAPEAQPTMAPTEPTAVPV
jgi:hypothetical protein